MSNKPETLHLNADFQEWFQSQQGVAYDGHYSFAMAAWNAAYQKATADNPNNQLLIDLVNQLGKKQKFPGNAPYHGHSNPGIWDADNGKLAGKPCAWCAIWNKAKQLTDNLQKGPSDE